MHSLKLTYPLKIGYPKKTINFPTIDLQGLFLLVSGRVNQVPAPWTYNHTFGTNEWHLYLWRWHHMATFLSNPVFWMGEVSECIIRQWSFYIPWDPWDCYIFLHLGWFLYHTWILLSRNQPKQRTIFDFHLQKWPLLHWHCRSPQNGQLIDPFFGSLLVSMWFASPRLHVQS